jgi:thioesterase domain-containing protein
VPLRRYLEGRGYKTYPWQQGLNLGPREGVLDGCVEQARSIAAAPRAPLSLVGWSLGGIYAREVAKVIPRRPDA